MGAAAGAAAPIMGAGAGVPRPPNIVGFRANVFAPTPSAGAPKGLVAAAAPKPPPNAGAGVEAPNALLAAGAPKGLKAAPYDDPAASPKGLAVVGDAASAAPKSFDVAADAAGVPKSPPLGALRRRPDAVAAAGAGTGAVRSPRSSAQTLSKRGFSSSAALSMRRVA